MQELYHSTRNEFANLLFNYEYALIFGKAVKFAETEKTLKIPSNHLKKSKDRKKKEKLGAISGNEALLQQYLQQWIDKCRTNITRSLPKMFL
ncbi:MAG: hypothetical protein K9W44_17210 [Candidatus Lokiarchaeota archaeon]|nr:hypothetical protein [Candidatus Harpocratesius repetitus]